MCIICRTGSTYTTPTGETISGYVLTYDLKLYIDDFPLIKKQYEKYEKLNDEYESHMSELDHKIENAIESNDVIIYNNDIINDIECKINNLYKEVNQLKDKNYKLIHSITEEIKNEYVFDKKNELDELNNLFD